MWQRGEWNVTIENVCDRVGIVPKPWIQHALSLCRVGAASLLLLVASVVSPVRAQVNVTERSYNQNRTGVNEA